MTGKGGVGKTMFCHALGTAHAERGARPVVVELLPRTDNAQPLQVEPQSAGYGVLRLHADAALGAYLEHFVRVRRVAQTVLRNATLQRFFRAAPGVEEVAIYQTLERLMDDDYDPVIVDLDATGHAQMFLELPKVLDEVLGPGPMRRLIDSFSQTLADDAVTALHVVTVPEPVVVEETEELLSALAPKRPLPLGALVINRIHESPLRLADRALLSELSAWDRALAERELDRLELQSAERMRLESLAVEPLCLAESDPAALFARLRGALQ
ncbi:MAG: ArsA-related P-loop ATPase [Myxococcota bacterium]